MVLTSLAKKTKKKETPKDWANALETANKENLPVVNPNTPSGGAATTGDLDRTKQGYEIGGVRFTDKAKYEQAKRLASLPNLGVVEQAQGEMINPEILAAAKNFQNVNAPPQLPETAPPPLAEDVKPSGMDALDVGSAIGAGVGGVALGAKIGAAGGSVVPGVGTAVGAIGGGILGGIGGVGGKIFFSSSKERRQQTLVAKQKFDDATDKMDMLINSANAQDRTKSDLRAWWAYEESRILQAERELKAQQDAAFGEKLSKSFDELQEIESWKNYYASIQLEFEIAMANPNPANIKTITPRTEEVESGGFFG